MAEADDNGMAWEFGFQGDPDLDDTAAVIALGSTPQVFTTGIHSLCKATPWASWTRIPGADAEAAAVGVWVGQHWWDLWCFEAARASDWLIGLPNALAPSVTPEWGNNAFRAMVVVGGLDLDVVYDDASAFLSAISAASKAARIDPRLLLEEKDCFMGEPPTAVSTKLAYAYAFAGDAFIEGKDCSALGRFGFLVRPKVTAAGRDGANDPYIRLMEALRSLTAVRSPFFKEQVDKPTGGNQMEIAELIADTWATLHKYSPMVCSAARPVKRALDVEMVSRLTFGSEEQKNTCFAEGFAQLLLRSERIEQAVDSDTGPLSEVIGRYEQLSAIVLPGARWNSLACASGVEVLLREWMPVLSTMLHLRGAERLGALRKAMEASKPAPIGSVQASKEDPKGALGASGQEAMQFQCFVDASEKLKIILAAEEPNLMDVFDTLLGSRSKLLYSVAMQQLKKSTGSSIIQDCSPFLQDLGSYWALHMGSVNGVAALEVQGKAIGDADVQSLVKGAWDEVDWIGISNQLDFWMNGVMYDGPVGWHEFEALKRMEDVMTSTFRMLRFGIDDLEDGDQLQPGGDNPGLDDDEDENEGEISVSFESLFKRILALQRKAGIMPKGSRPRKNHEDNVAGLVRQMLKSAGRRWRRQFQGEVNYKADLQRFFLTDSNDVLNTLCKHEEVASQLFKFKDTLPGLLGAWEVESPESADEYVEKRQRSNPPLKEGDHL